MSASNTSSGANDQWLRKAGLLVFPATTGPGLDLSDLHFRFQVSQSDIQTPNIAVIRIYNASKDTVNRIEKEFQKVTLQAGYQNGAYGIIFQGTIKQTHKGRERNVDGYIEIHAADADQLYGFGVVNRTLGPNATVQDQANAFNQVVNEFGISGVDANGLVGGILPRGKILFGMAHEEMRNLGTNTGTTWSIQDGKVVAIPLTGYLPGQVLEINSRTGMIGIPEATQNGINVMTLLNPKIQIGQRIRINNADINQVTQQQLGYPSWTGVQFFADTSADGIYRVLVSEFEGDTRGEPWYSKLVCLAVDPTAQPAFSVKEYG